MFLGSIKKLKQVTKLLAALSKLHVLFFSVEEGLGSCPIFSLHKHNHVISLGPSAYFTVYFIHLLIYCSLTAEYVVENIYDSKTDFNISSNNI